MEETAKEAATDNMERMLAKYNYSDDRQKCLESKAALLDLLNHKMVQLETKLLQQSGSSVTSNGPNGTTLAPTSRLRTFLPFLDLLHRISGSAAGRTPEEWQLQAWKTIAAEQHGNCPNPNATTTSTSSTTSTHQQPQSAQPKSSQSRRGGSAGEGRNAQTQTSTTTTTSAVNSEKLTELEQRLAQKGTELRQVQQNLDKLTTKLSTTETKNKELAQQLTASKRKPKTVTVDTQTTNTTNQQQSTGLGAHKMHVELNRKQARIDELTKQLEKSKESGDEHQRNIDTITQQLHDAQASCSRKDAEISELEKMGNALCGQLKEQQATFDARMAEKDQTFVNTNQNIMSQYQARIANLEEINEHQKDVINNVQQLKEKEEKKVASQQAHIAELLKELTQHQELSTQVEGLQTALQSKIKDFERLTTSNAMHTNQLLNENKQLQEKLQTLSQKFCVLQANVEQKEKQREEQQGAAAMQTHRQMNDEIETLKRELEASVSSRVQLQMLLEEKMEYKDTFEQVLFNELKTMRSAFLIQINQFKAENDTLRKKLQEKGEDLAIPTNSLAHVNQSITEAHLKQLMGRCATAEAKERPVLSRGGARRSPAVPNPGFGL
eukprot:TRINITY_DN26495_c0_g1_i1.p1 TRINITY_DN26495_c0_g1~~TRINITY_DN26495_c0_g1_i1.p1  ORF type:complete len:684 (-),score=78.26 TRINITY_DN26495_c0_g1_i1:84-1910(-)